MGSSICFYKVKKIDEIIPSVLNIDKTPLPETWHDVPVSRAEKWEQEIGRLCHIQYMTVNPYSVAEKKFSKRPTSYTIGAFRTPYRFWDNGVLVGEIEQCEMEKYRYLKTDEVYIYIREEISCSDSAYILDTGSGIKTFDDLLKMLKTCVEYDYVDAGLVTAVAKAMFEAKDGAIIYCDVG